MEVELQEKSRFCNNDSYALRENTATGKLYFECICGFSRLAGDEETMLFEETIGAINTAGHLTAENIAEDDVCARIPINCSCGCKVANYRNVGEEKKSIKICLKCHKNID